MRTRTEGSGRCRKGISAAPVKATPPQPPIFTFIRPLESAYQMAFTFIRASTSSDPGLLTAPSLAHP